MDEKFPWNPSEKIVVDEALDALFKKIDEKGGITFDFETLFYSQILNCLLEKADLKVDSKSVLAKTKRKRGNDVACEFYKIAREKISKNNSHYCKWRFFIPLKCKLASDVQQPLNLKVYEINFYFSNWQDVEKEIEKKELHKIFNSSRISFPSTCLVVESSGDSVENAFDKIAPAFDVFRGLIEMPHTWAKNSIFQLHSFNKNAEKPRRWLPCPEWFIGLSDKKEIKPGKFLIEGNSNEEEVTLSFLDIQVIEKLRLDFEKKPISKSSISSLVADCFRLYVQALDEKLDHNAFLAFWQLLETIALSKGIGGDTDEVCKRTNKILKIMIRSWLNNQNCTLYLLRILAEKRNKLVHQGKREGIDYRDVTFLKVFCQHGISFLLSFSKPFPTIQQLQDFYQLSEERSENLEFKKQVITYVLDKRK